MVVMSTAGILKTDGTNHMMNTTAGISFHGLPTAITTKVIEAEMERGPLIADMTGAMKAAQNAVDTMTEVDTTTGTGMTIEADSMKGLQMEDIPGQKKTGIEDQGMTGTHDLKTTDIAGLLMAVLA